jgi:hypothetical protein
MRRFMSLDDKNARLKKIVAGLTLDREIPHDMIRRACQAVQFDTLSYHYKSR